jgi:hypothetical protein
MRRTLILLPILVIALSITARASLINITLVEGGGAVLPLTFPGGRRVPLAAKNLGTVSICELGVSLAGDDCSFVGLGMNGASDSVTFVNI